MKSEFALAFNQICADYNLPREVVLDAIRAALATAYRRDWKVPATQNVEAEISLETGLARIYLEKMVVEAEVEDEQIEITLPDARKHQPSAQVDEAILLDVTPRNFGRIAAQTAKQVITQRLREAERESQFNRFSRQENEIIIGTVQSVNPRGVTLHLERTEEAHMPRREQIPGERYVIHQKIRVYVLEVRRTSRGPEIIASRSHPLMLRRLLELEVPEIRSGQVEINAVAREAGTRAKVAVSSRQDGIDPVGACVGMRGIRIQTISNELHGERIDVVLWSEDPETFISTALSLPAIVSVTLDETNPGGRTASVAVLDEHLSLAIGRSGQNARLAAKLTNWRIDIQGATEAGMWAIERVNQTPELLDALRAKATQIPRLAAIMRMHEEDRYPYTDEERHVIGDVVKAVRQAMIARRDAERPGSVQTRERERAQADADAERVKAKQEAQARVPRGAYKVPLADLGLQTRVRNHLLASGLENVGQVMEKLAVGDEPLLMISGIGVKALREIKTKVETSGLKLLIEGEEDETPVEATPETAVAEGEVAEAVEPAEAAPAEEVSVAEVAAEAASDEEPLEDDTAEAEAAEIDAVAASEPEETEPESEAPTESEVVGAEPEEADDTDIFVEAFGTPEETPVFAEPEGADDDDDDARDRRSKKRRRRTVVFDDDIGETIVVRKHRRSTSWNEFGEDY